MFFLCASYRYASKRSQTMVVGTELGKRSPRGLSSPCVVRDIRGVTGRLRGVYIDAKLHDVSRPTGMCLTDGQILTGQGRDGVPFSRIREEEFDGNSQGTSGESKEDGTELYRLQVSYDGGFGIMMVSRAKHFVKRFVFGALLK